MLKYELTKLVCHAAVHSLNNAVMMIPECGREEHTTVTECRVGVSQPLVHGAPNIRHNMATVGDLLVTNAKPQDTVVAATPLPTKGLTRGGDLRKSTSPRLFNHSRV